MAKNDAIGIFYTWRTAILKSDLPPTTRHVLLTLSCHMNEAGEGCFPSTRLLADETGLSEKSVVTHLQIAEERGWIIKQAHGLGGQKWKRHEYHPNYPQGTELRSAPQGKKGAEGGSAPKDGKGTERRSAPSKEKGTEPRSAASPEGTEVDSAPSEKGTEPLSEKALNDVQCSSSINNSINSSSNTVVPSENSEAEKMPPLEDSFSRMKSVPSMPVSELHWAYVFDYLGFPPKVTKAPEVREMFLRWTAQAISKQMAMELVEWVKSRNNRPINSPLYFDKILPEFISKKGDGLVPAAPIRREAEQATAKEYLPKAELKNWREKVQLPDNLARSLNNKSAGQ